MKISKSTIIGKVRTAIDEILPESVKSIDTFWADQDAEIWQAVQIAAEQLCMELPRELLEPKNVVGNTSVMGTAVSTGSGNGYVDVGVSGGNASDYLSLYELKLTTWTVGVTETLSPGSAEAQMQGSKYTCGTPKKPKVVEVKMGAKTRLYYWSAGKTNGQVNHSIEILTYIPRPTVTAKTGSMTDDEIEIPLIDSALSYIIYRAGRLVLTSKKETALAQEMEAIAGSMKA